MDEITVDLDEIVFELLQQRAIAAGHSVEDEAREILIKAIHPGEAVENSST